MLYSIKKTIYLVSQPKVAQYAVKVLCYILCVMATTQLSKRKESAAQFPVICHKMARYGDKWCHAR